MKRPSPAPLFRFVRRPVENTESFNAVLLVPTGIGAEIGGHAGDAAPVAALLASVCDTLITHPNVVNASDIIDLPANTLYVEGSIITRLLLGALGLQRARNNRLLVAIGHHQDELFTHAAINSVNAARSSYGLTVPRIIQLGPELEMDSSYTGSGRAAGRVRGLDCLFEALDECAGEYDAVAITSQIIVPPGYHADYFDSMGAMVNPWGGVEAMLTHAVSALYDIPSAHSPMLETQEIANEDPGIVDPRMAAEAVSLALLQCILKGLQRSPQIITDPIGMMHHSILTAADISCLVIPGRLYWPAHPGRPGAGNTRDCGPGKPQPDAQRPDRPTLGSRAVTPGRKLLGSCRDNGSNASRYRPGGSAASLAAVNGSAEGIVARAWGSDYVPGPV